LQGQTRAFKKSKSWIWWPLQQTCKGFAFKLFDFNNQEGVPVSVEGTRGAKKKQQKEGHAYRLRSSSFLLLLGKE